MVSSSTCPSSLAAGASCQFDLVFTPSRHQNSAPWTGDLTETASPGGTAHVSVTAQYTSKLVFEDRPATLIATPGADAATHFQITNSTAGDIGPIDFNFTVIGGMVNVAGTFTATTDNGVAIPPCSDMMTLHGGDSCQWLVTYTNVTGSGSNTARLTFDTSTVHGSVLFSGVGSP